MGCLKEKYFNKKAVGSFYLPLRNAYSTSDDYAYSLKGFFVNEDFVIKALENFDAGQKVLLNDYTRQFWGNDPNGEHFEAAYDFVENYDGQRKEPTILPSKFPNILVNGANGISAGYATEIPPHNPGEIIDAVIHRIAVAQKFKGQGLGKKTFLEIEKIVKNDGYDTIRIDTHHDNLVMQQVLNKHGFMKCGVIYLKNGNPRLAYHYEKGKNNE